MGKRFKAPAPAVAASLAVLLFSALSGCSGFVTMEELMNLLSSDIAAVEPNIVVQLTDETRIDNGTGEYNFGSIINDATAGGFASSPITFKVYNKGGFKSSLSVTSVSLSAGDTADFVLSAVGETSLDFDESLSFTIRFDPTKASSLSATVTIRSNDPDTASFTFTARGTGVVFSLPCVAVPATVVAFSQGFAGIAGPRDVASITAFEMGRHEVTYPEWTSVKTWAIARGYTFANPGMLGKNGSYDLEPVTSISWRDALAWCNAASEFGGATPCYYTSSLKTTVYKNATVDPGLTNDCVLMTANGYRLPTEAEWEYAARWTSTGSAAGNSPSGAAVGLENTVAWWQNNSQNFTYPVEGKLPNALGIYDMSGNVYEWCWDQAAAYTGNVDADYMGPEVPTTSRIIRGGYCWSSASELATSYRTDFSYAYNSGLNILGFRVVRRP
jgi:sulfatase modifying factor 1